MIYHTVNKTRVFILLVYMCRPKVASSLPHPSTPRTPNPCTIYCKYHCEVSPNMQVHTLVLSFVLPLEGVSACDPCSSFSILSFIYQSVFLTAIDAGITHKVAAISLHNDSAERALVLQNFVEREHGPMCNPVEENSARQPQDCDDFSALIEALAEATVEKPSTPPTIFTFSAPSPLMFLYFLLLYRSLLLVRWLSPKRLQRPPISPR